jgi:predicted RNA-binding protein with PUA-like domain
MKSEGDCYPISKLKADKVTSWTGVRNYQARNYMKDMKVGDMILFYHSSSKPTGIYGLAKVVKKAHGDMTAFDKKGEYFEAKATEEKPIWECVDIKYVSTFKKPISLEELRKHEKIHKMKLFQKGSRLSIMPVTEGEYEYICTLG